MSTLEATLSMLEVMPEEAQKKVFDYTQTLFTSNRPANPFTPLSEKQILHDLEISEKQISSGQCREAKTSIEELRKKHGFI
jgi:hypothetical protein